MNNLAYMPRTQKRLTTGFSTALVGLLQSLHSHPSSGYAFRLLIHPTAPTIFLTLFRFPTQSQLSMATYIAYSPQFLPDTAPAHWLHMNAGCNISLNLLWDRNLLKAALQEN